jgi:hypothetical protein
MSDGVLYKFNATTWSKSQSKKLNATTISDGKVRHANATTWYDNYPMEQSYTQTFSATWSQGWLGNGTRLDDGVWDGNIITGSTTNYRGMFGFNKTAIADFIEDGTVTAARLHINCYETTTNGAPDVEFGKHNYTAEPSGTWDGVAGTNWSNLSTLHVPNQATGGYWVTLNPAQIRLTDGTAIGGIALRGASATDEDMGKFSGISSYNTQLEITVLK